MSVSSGLLGKTIGVVAVSAVARVLSFVGIIYVGIDTRRKTRLQQISQLLVNPIHLILVRVKVSVVLTNSPYIFNLDYNHYINNNKAIREAMCFMMDPMLGKTIFCVHFSQRFDGIDRNYAYANRNVVFFNINMKGLDGVQGPIYVGTGCVFRRQALNGLDAPKHKNTG